MPSKKVDLEYDAHLKIVDEVINYYICCNRHNQYKIWKFNTIRSTGIKQRLHISETNMVARDRYVIARHGAPQSSPRGVRLHHAEELNHHLVRAFHAQALFPDGVGLALVNR